jgi:hypothetical protein
MNWKLVFPSHAILLQACRCKMAMARAPDRRTDHAARSRPVVEARPLPLPPRPNIDRRRHSRRHRRRGRKRRRARGCKRERRQRPPKGSAVGSRDRSRGARGRPRRGRIWTHRRVGLAVADVARLSGRTFELDQLAPLTASPTAKQCREQRRTEWHQTFPSRV